MQEYEEDFFPHLAEARAHLVSFCWHGVPSTLTRLRFFPFSLLDRDWQIEFEQGPGDAIFVPSGWYHDVRFAGSQIVFFFQRLSHMLFLPIGGESGGYAERKPQLDQLCQYSLDYLACTCRLPRCERLVAGMATT
jgi:hypothetical protein